MANYDELDTLVTALKISAINAWMKSERWIGSATAGGWMKMTTAGTTGFFEEVTGTDANGEGGGKVSVNNVDQDHITDFSDGFSSIRSGIDGVIAPWRILPDPDIIDGWITPMRDATSEIAISAVDTKGAPTGGGKIVGQIELAVTAADDWAGATAAAFKLNFLSQLATATGGSYALCLCLGGHLEAQKGIWTETRQGVADIVENTTKAYDAIAYDSGLSWGLVFKVLGYAAAGAALFAAGGPAAPIAAGIAGIGVTVASDGYEAISNAQDSPGDQYDAVRDKMPKYFEALNNDVKKEETSIRQNLDHNLNVVLANKSTFDLARPKLLDVADDSDLSKDNIFYRDQQVRDMCSTYLPAIAANLFRASTSAQASYKGSFYADFNRGDGIGIDVNGPMEEWANLWSVTYSLLSDLGEETKASATTLDLAMSDIGKADSNALDALGKHAKDAAAIGTGDDFYIIWGEHRDTDA